MTTPVKFIVIAVASLILVDCGGASNRPHGVATRNVSASDQASRALITAARVSEETGDYGLAVGYFRKLYERDQSNQSYIVGLSRNLRYGGKAAEARLFMDLITGESADGPEIRAEYGKALLSDGLPEQAVENLSQAIDTGASSWQNYSALGAARDRLGKFDGAQEAYNAATGLSPNNPLIKNNQALSLALSGRLKLAIEMLEGVASRPGATPKLRQNLAMLLALNGDVKAARSLGRVDLTDQEVQNNLDYYQELLTGRGTRARR